MSQLGIRAKVKAEAIRAKVRVGAFKAKVGVGSRASQGKCFVSSASSLDI